MTQFVVALAVVVALGVVLLAAHQVWSAVMHAGRREPVLAAPAVPPAPVRAALYAVEVLQDEPISRARLASWPHRLGARRGQRSVLARHPALPPKWLGFDRSKALVIDSESAAASAAADRPMTPDLERDSVFPSH